MVDDPLTQDAGTAADAARRAAGSEPRAFLVIDDLVDADHTSRVVDLPDGHGVTFGRSQSCDVHIDHESVSRTHACVRRTGDTIEVEDLGSRNGTRVNGERIDGVRRLASGDEVSIGPVIAVVGVTSQLRRASPIADTVAAESRLAAEVDRSVRYHRPLTLGLMRIRGEAAVDAVARALRPMDLIAEDVGDEFLLILPELDRHGGTSTIARLCEVARGAGAEVAASAALSPDDGTTVDALIGYLREHLRTGGSVRARPPTAPTDDQTIVHDPAMKRVYALVERIAATPLTVLILGETGVGKEVVAEAIHRRSGRADQPFIKLNCAALPETLLESELFGHERGAFTGAERRKLGFFEAAAGGTLFLDEIGEMPPALQAKLLRVLERKVITRVGGTSEVPVDVRLIAATHRDLEHEVRRQGFRQDLLYRVGGFTLVVPPLRDRPSEILPLAEYFARVASAQQGRRTPAISEDARAALTAYVWPGNVRELRNAVERALVLCDDAITTIDLPERLLDAGARVRPLALETDVRGHLAEVERDAIIAALDAENDNQTRAARRLGLSRRTLIYKMEKYGLKAKPTRGDG